MKRNWNFLAWLLGAAILVPAGTSAHEDKESESDAAASHQNLITANPFGFVFEWFNVEYERKIRANTTLGFTASYATPDGGTLATGNVILRLYPQGTALKGFYIGGRTGTYYLNDYDDNGTFLGAGVEVGYTWLMGANKNWYLGMGAGVTRLFGGVSGSAVFPQVRFVNFGYAF